MGNGNLNFGENYCLAAKLVVKNGRSLLEGNDDDGVDHDALFSKTERGFPSIGTKAFTVMKSFNSFELT